MRRPILRSAQLIFATAFAALASVSCGASLQALYEGDVRFEHCMALDARPEVPPAERKSCWEDWNAYYAFGQTRDRIEYARRRITELHDGRDDGDDDLGKRVTRVAGPDPTNFAAPPPIMVVVDAGPPPDAGPPTDPKAVAHAACLDDCDRVLVSCKKLCKGTPCDWACGGRKNACLKKCP